jgi:hypothetical protein
MRDDEAPLTFDKKKSKPPPIGEKISYDDESNLAHWSNYFDE